MKNALKRSLSILLAVAIIFSSAYVGLAELDFSGLFAVKADAASESDLTFTLSSDGTYYTVTGCASTASGELIIPATYADLPVTGIKKMAFLNKTKLTSVVLSDGIKDIGDYAFWGCTNLISCNRLPKWV